MKIITALTATVFLVSCGKKASDDSTSEFHEQIEQIDSKSFKVPLTSCENAELKTQVDKSKLRVFSEIVGPCHSQVVPKIAVFNCSESDQHCITEKLQSGFQYILKISSSKTLAISQVYEETSGEIKVFSTEIWYPK